MTSEMEMLASHINRASSSWRGSDSDGALSSDDVIERSDSNRCSATYVKNADTKQIRAKLSSEYLH